LKKQILPPEYSKQADKYLNNLDSKSEQRIKDSIEKIPSGDIIPYKAKAGYFRLRVGSHRILFRWVNDIQILIAVIDSRGQVYKKGV
jgi:mRNA-degrading endonuclease RelE of RelBE toxin-antitoxin system